MNKVNLYIKDVKRDLTITIRLEKDYTKEEILRDKQSLIDLAKKEFPNAKSIELLIPIESQIKKDRLMRIGEEEASSWGGKCLKVTTYENLVCFECVEHGEKFETYMTYKEIEEEYKNIQ